MYFLIVHGERLHDFLRTVHGFRQFMALRQAVSPYSQKCFEAFLGVWANNLPEGHELPKSMYDTKKIMKALSMDYEKIDVCPKNCLLFRHEYADDKYCRKCGSSRYIEVVDKHAQKQ